MKRLILLLSAVLMAVASSAQEKTIKILAIGNSFSNDATNNHLYEIGKAAGYNFVIGNLYIGGCSLERHWNNAQSGEDAYSYEKQVNGAWTKVKHSLEYGLKDEDWDIVTVQQVSGDSGHIGSYEPYLTDLLKYAKARVPKKAKFYFHQTWAYAGDSNHQRFIEYGADTDRMYNAIIGTVSQVCSKHKLGVIPSGTAVQNGRTSLIGDNFTRDGYHMSFTIGRYTVACTWFETITGTGVVENAYQPDGIHPDFARLCRLSAHNAVLNPWSVTPFAGPDCFAANPLANYSKDPGQCGIFHNWGFIGDSLSSGEFEYKDENIRICYDRFEYSWGQRMCAYMGVKGDNYSQGGETSKGWIQHFWDSNKNKQKICAKDDPKPVYMIALGHNDRTRLKRKITGYENFLPGDVKTDVNFEDYTKNADSFAGCYAGIIQRVRSLEPDCHIFVVTPGSSDPTLNPYTEVIRSMAGIFQNVYVIDLNRYATAIFDKQGFWGKKHYQVGHFNAAGYEETAAMMMKYIDWIIRMNYTKFQDVGWIGTGKLPKQQR